MSFIANKTVKLRHKVVKLIAPKLYSDYMVRPMTRFLKTYYQTDSSLVGAEIGVAAGDNAISILQELPMKKLYLIDPYVPYIQDSKLLSFEECYDKATKRLKFQQAIWIKKPSSEAVKDLNEPLDFVYIDGNHSYEYVRQDIANYYPLVKPNGVIGGHDYVPFNHDGVVKAVNEFVEGHRITRFYIGSPDWWIVKGCFQLSCVLEHDRILPKELFNSAISSTT